MPKVILVDAYTAFMATARPFIHIADEQAYRASLEELEHLMEAAGDSEDDRLDPLISLLVHAIERYESQDERLMAFVAEAEAIPADIALLKTLMDQHQLTGSDLPEIGGKAMVSKVLSGKRQLSRKAIEALAASFGLRPAMFFGGFE